MFRTKVGDFGAVTDEIVTEADRAVSLTMDEVTLGLKTELRQQVIAAGLGARLANTWQGRRYPLSRFSANAAAFVWSKAPKLISAFDQGVTIRSASGFYLAIPTPAAGPRGIGAGGRSARITPAGWERRTGLRLRFVFRPGRPSLLVADDARLGKAGLAKSGVRRRDGNEYVRVQGRIAVVIFILVPQVTLRKRFDIGSLADRWADQVAALLPTHWN